MTAPTHAGRAAGRLHQRPGDGEPAGGTDRLVHRAVGGGAERVGRELVEVGGHQVRALEHHLEGGALDLRDRVPAVGDGHALDGHGRRLGRCGGPLAAGLRVGAADGVGRAPCTARRTESWSSMPSQPVSSRVYSGRSAASRMPATIGAAARRAPIRPSAVRRS